LPLYSSIRSIIVYRLDTFMRPYYTDITHFCPLTPRILRDGAQMRMMYERLRTP